MLFTIGAQLLFREKPVFLANFATSELGITQKMTASTRRVAPTLRRQMVSHAHQQIRKKPENAANPAIFLAINSTMLPISLNSCFKTRQKLFKIACTLGGLSAKLAWLQNR